MKAILEFAEATTVCVGGVGDFQPKRVWIGVHCDREERERRATAVQ